MSQNNQILGLGNDIVEIDRIEEALNRHPDHFLQKLFTASEIRKMQQMKKPAAHIAGRFAAKEAIAKALGVGFGKELSWHDIEIINSPEGKPVATFSEVANTRFQSPRILLSISHGKMAAIAVAIWTS